MFNTDARGLQSGTLAFFPLFLKNTSLRGRGISRAELEISLYGEKTATWDLGREGVELLIVLIFL